MILSITQFGDPVLRKRCREVKEFTPAHGVVLCAAMEMDACSTEMMERALIKCDQLASDNFHCCWRWQAHSAWVLI